MFPIYCPKGVGDIPAGSELLHLFPVFQICRAGQILLLEFSKNGLAYHWDEFTDGGVVNQPVILQGCVGLPVLLLVSIQLLRAS